MLVACTVESSASGVVVTCLRCGVTKRCSYPDTASVRYCISSLRLQCGEINYYYAEGGEDEGFWNNMSEDQFMSRWSLDDLQQIDPELHVALLDQQNMLDEHTKAMQRGWQAALTRMEEHEIAAALAVFPGATVSAIREKRPPDVD